MVFMVAAGFGVPLQMLSEAIALPEDVNWRLMRFVVLEANSSFEVIDGHREIAQYRHAQNAAETDTQLIAHTLKTHGQQVGIILPEPSKYERNLMRSGGS